METAMLPGSGQTIASSDPEPATLMERFLGKDPSAAQELYRRFAPRIYAMGKAMLGSEEQAEELVQDTFVNLWRQAASFDPAQGSLDRWVLVTALRSVRRPRA
jgi:DNA-directed RNA polymerase specialized sigma24 family protein